MTPTKPPSPPKPRGLRPLSQTGFIRVPANPHQRRITADGIPTERHALDAYNEKLAKDDLTLHPTKGFRLLSAKRTVAAMLVAEMKAGMAPFSMKRMRRQLKAVR